jgi:hypothetical protein
MSFKPPHMPMHEQRERQISPLLTASSELQLKDLSTYGQAFASHPDCRSPHYCQTHMTPASSEAILRAACSRAIIIAMKSLLVATTLCASLSCAMPAAQQSAKADPQKSQESADQCAMHDAHSKMNERGRKGMGFSQTANTHHFLLKPDGGAIQVETNDPKDNAARDSIRTHLTHIVHAFSAGDFDIPMFVHDTVPPGVPDLKRLKEKITYSFQETPAGGRVVIATSDPESLAAIHKFLRFQIEEHQTHDPMTVQ